MEMSIIYYSLKQTVIANFCYDNANTFPYQVYLQIYLIIMSKYIKIFTCSEPWNVSSNPLHHSLNVNLQFYLFIIFRCISEVDLIIVSNIVQITAIECISIHSVSWPPGVFLSSLDYRLPADLQIHSITPFKYLSKLTSL